MSKEKCYVSGRISGIHIVNAKQNFIFACKEVEKYNSLVAINPFDIKPLFRIKKWLFFMISDILVLRKCQYIAMQQNWVQSRGSVIEYFFAKFIFKIKVIFL